MALRHVAKELKFPFSLICKENEAEQFKSTDKTIPDVGRDLQICPYTLCTFVLPTKPVRHYFYQIFFFFTVWTDFLRWFICTNDKGADVFGVCRERTVDISMAFPPNTGPVWHSEWGSKCSQKLRRAVSQYDPCCHIWSLTNQIPWQLMQKQTEYIEAKDSKQKVC